MTYAQSLLADIEAKVLAYAQSLLPAAGTTVKGA